MKKVRKFFETMGMGLRIQTPSDRQKLLLEDPDVQKIASMAYEEARNDVLYARTYKTRETLIQSLKEAI